MMIDWTGIDEVKNTIVGKNRIVNNDNPCYKLLYLALLLIDFEKFLSKTT